MRFRCTVCLAPENSHPHKGPDLLKKDKDSRGARLRPSRKAGTAVLTSTELQGLQDYSESLILASQRLYSILDRQTLGLALCEEACQLLGAHTAAVLCVDEGKWDLRAALATAGGELAGRSVLGQCAPVLFHLGQTVLKTNVPEAADLEIGPVLLGPMRT